MNVSWCLRKLSKEIDRVIEIKWSYRDVDKVTDQMSIVSRVALFCAEVNIECMSTSVAIDLDRIESVVYQDADSLNTMSRLTHFSGREVKAYVPILLK